MKYLALVPVVLAVVGSLALAPACSNHVFDDSPQSDKGEGGDASGGSTSSDDIGQGGGAGGDVVVLPPEDCSNGKDDDQDGKTDGEDSECEACSPAVPDGWTGPMNWFAGAPAFKPDCDSPLIQAGNNPEADELTCAACACGSSGTKKCAVDIEGRQSGSSGMVGHACFSQIWPKVTLGTACYAPPPEYVAPYLLVTAYKASGETCTPSGGSVSARPEARFDSIALGCKVDVEQSNCGDGNFVRPESPAGFSGKLCISQAGELECPATYPEKSLHFGSIDDQRKCAKCSCSSDLSCAGSVSVYTNSGCTGTAYGMTVAEYTCYQNTSVTEKGYKLGSISYAGGCKPSTATEEGALVAADPVTVCCR